MGLFSTTNIEKLRVQGKTKKLIKILNSHKNYDLRREAASALGIIRDKSAVEPLIIALKSPGSRLKIDAAEALGDIGDDRALPALIQCLESESEDLIITAAEALGNIKNAEAIDPLLKLTENRLLHVKVAAIKALGMIGDEKVVDALNKFFWEDSDEVKTAVINALRDIGSENALKLLKQFYKASPPGIRQAAAKALTNLGFSPDKEHADDWTQETAEKPVYHLPAKLEALVKSKGDLPAIPDIVFKLNSMLYAPDCTLKDVAGLIKTDSALTARVVQVANSAYFSRGGVEIIDVQTAITRLGIYQMRNIVFAFSVLKQFDAAKLIDKRKFWKHSFVAAQIAKSLTNILRETEVVQEKAYMSGLMHDIGIAVMSYIIPGAYERFLRMTVGDKTDIHDFSLHREEREAFGTDHAVVGAAYIDHWWPVDNTIIHTVLNHHGKVEDEKLSRLAKIVIIANDYCMSVGIDNGVNFQLHLEPFDKDKFKTAGLSEEQIEKFYTVAEGEIEAADMLLSMK